MSRKQAVIEQLDDIADINGCDELDAETDEYDIAKDLN